MVRCLICGRMGFLKNWLNSFKEMTEDYGELSWMTEEERQIHLSILERKYIKQLRIDENRQKVAGILADIRTTKGRSVPLVSPPTMIGRPIPIPKTPFIWIQRR